MRRQLRPEIYDSWERSYQYRVNPGLKKLTLNIPAREFEKACEESKYLMQIAIPVMERLSQFVKGTGFVVALADANCIGLKIIGDKKSTEWSQQVNMTEGTVWTEDKAGTNGLSVANALVKPISVNSYEHFCLAHTPASSSYAPIVDNGRLIGSIGMVAPYDRVSHHTLGMVVAAADHIQSVLALDRISQYNQVVTDSMSDGVMVVDGNGTITYMNNKCKRILGLNSLMAGTTLNTLFGRNPENDFFINTVAQGKIVTDDYMLLYLGKNPIPCHITCTPMHSANPADVGSVVILREAERINTLVGKWIGRSAKMNFDHIIGQNPRFQETIAIARTAAQSDSNVLLLGESGVGKDVIAQAMHNESYRKNNPFLAINCAALPRELISSELFGYEEGAFTGAKKGGNVGKFELANQGTLFLDEIGDVPLDLQVSLLRVLEEKSVIRLGGNKMIPVNVRIIAATNKKLEEAIARDRFRRDLYYRLGVIKLVIPPLRERKDDIPLLVEHFLKIICKRFDKPVKKLTPEAIDVLMAYDWPGNIRELQNVLEVAIQLSPGEFIYHEFLTRYLEPGNHLAPAETRKTVYPVENFNTQHQEIPEEQRVLEQTLRKNKWNKSKTAEDLGISRQCLYRRLYKYNLVSPSDLM